MNIFDIFAAASFEYAVVYLNLAATDLDEFRWDRDNALLLALALPSDLSLIHI